MIYYVYQADVWCEDCGHRICEDLKAKGEAPEDPEDQYTYESDHYPKAWSGDEPTDTPQHCASGENCLNAIELHNGAKVGAIVGDYLTDEGMKYVMEAIVEDIQQTSSRDATIGTVHSLNVVALWAKHFDITLQDVLEYVTKGKVGEV